MNKLNAHALGLSIALFSALCMLLMGLAAAAGFYLEAYAIMVKFHIFAGQGLLGMILGIVEGAISGYIIGYVVAWLYNKFADQK